MASMAKWLEKLRQWDRDWNHLGTKALRIVVLLIVLSALVTIFPYIAPFVMAGLLAWLMHPLVHFVGRLFGKRAKLGRGIATGLVVLIILSIIVIVLLLLVGQVWNEGRDFITTLPTTLNRVTASVNDWFLHMPEETGWILPDWANDAIASALSEITMGLSVQASRLASSAARNAWQVAAILPQAILFVVLTFVGTFYLSVDPERTFIFLRKQIPERLQGSLRRMRTGAFQAIVSQMRAAMVMMGVTFIVMLIGFSLMRIDYSILFALVIAVVDVLPVLGVGMFMIPLGIYGIIIGNWAYAIGGFSLYLLIICMRQFVEPRIISRALGLYPLATMMAMYAGLHLMGFVGMLAGPLLLLLCKVAVTDEPLTVKDPQTLPPHE